jgi:DNA-binding Xre family transcriptional regulator
MCIFVAIINLTTMTNNKDLNRLKVILAEKKKTNLWLSKQLGCAPTTVSKWCTNSSQPPLETLIKITKLLDVDINELVRFEEVDKN